MRFFKNLLKIWATDISNYVRTETSEKITLEKRFLNEVRLRKELNSQRVWSNYYIPIAAKQMTQNKENITKDNIFRLECLANSLMFKDMADGKLNEFYRFTESEV